MESELRAYHRLFAEQFVLRERRPAAARRGPARPELWLDEAAVAIHRAQIIQSLGHPAAALTILSQPLAQPYPGLSRHADAAGEAVLAAIALIYTGPRGCTWLDRRLYLPPAWFEPERPAADIESAVPAWITYKSGVTLGAEMLLANLAGGSLPVRWINLDQAYCRELRLLEELHHRSITFCVETGRHQPVWLKPAGLDQDWTRATADFLAAGWPAQAWQPAEASAEVAATRLALDRSGRPGLEGWLIVQRPAGSPAIDQWRFFLSNAPASQDKPTLIEMLGGAAPAARVLAECQTDPAEDSPGWAGWHHHTALTMLAHHFLVLLRNRFGAAAPALDVAQTRQILHRVLAQPEFDIQPALAEIERIQQQNLTAYLQLKEAQAFGWLEREIAWGI